METTALELTSILWKNIVEGGNDRMDEPLLRLFASRIDVPHRLLTDVKITQK